MTTGDLSSQNVASLIAAGLTRQEWLTDRRKSTILLLRLIPGSSWLITTAIILTRPRLANIACVRAKSEDKVSLIRQLLAQGNCIGDLFNWTPQGLSKERLNKEMKSVDLIRLIIGDKDISNPRKIAITLIESLQSQLEPEPNLILESMKQSLIQAIAERIQPYSQKIDGNTVQLLAFARAINNLKIFIETLCQRLTKNKQYISDVLGIDIIQDKPKTAKMGCGDIHIDGKSTTLIIVQSGKKFLYKPRDMALEAVLRDILVPDSIPKILLGDGYGFQEFVETNSPNEHVGTQLGKLIAQLDVLGAVDIHHENLIFGTNKVSLVDGETILHRRFIAQRENQMKLPALGDSVLVLGVITPPVRKTLAGGHFWQMDHGLSRLVTQKKIVNYMHQENELVPLTAFEINLLKGFEQLQRKSREREFLTWKSLKQFRGLRRRVVMRNTSIYSSLKREIFQVSKKCDTEEILDKLWKLFLLNPNHSQLSDLATVEAIELAKGHIPFFTTKIGSRKLDRVHGIQLPANQHRTVLQDAKRRQRERTSRNQQLCQVTLLRSALLLFRQPDLNKQNLNPGDIRYAIQIIINHLDKTALNWKGEKLWLTVQRMSGSKTCFVVDRRLYGGSEGINLVLHWLDGKKHLATGLRSNNWKSIEALDAHAIAEINGDLLAWSLNSKKTDSLPQQWFQSLHRIKQNITQRLNHTQKFSEFSVPCCDLISGLAGLIGSVNLTLNKCNSRDSDALVQLQLKISELLLILQEEDGSWPEIDPLLTGLTGWSHGSAGIAAALGVVHTKASAVMASQIRIAIDRAIKHELNWLDEYGNWIDKRTLDLENSEAKGRGVSWCHGAPGALLAAVVLHRSELDYLDNVRIWREFALSSTLGARPCVDGLCCGNSGLLLIQEMAAREFNDSRLLDRAQELRGELAKKACNRQLTFADYFPLRYHPPGLFDGYSGVALALASDGNDLRVQKLLSHGLISD